MPELITVVYLCSNCKEPLTEANWIKDSKNKNGLHSWCRDCRSHQRRQRYAENDQDDIDRLRRKHLWRTYGLTLEQFDEMLYSQLGRCKACHEPFLRHRDIHVDHCHATRQVRGLLCNDCNTALGLVKESVERTQALADYITEYCSELESRSSVR